MNRQQCDVPGGTIEYLDSAGDGPVVVMVHGALMDEQLWLPVAGRLSQRCVIPVLPIGAHRIPRPEAADQSPRGVARLLGEFIDALGLQQVTLVGNDTGGALIQLLIAERPDIVDRIVLVSCDAYDNFPPGLPGRTMALAAAVPRIEILADTRTLVPLDRPAELAALIGDFARPPRGTAESATA